MEIYGLTGNSTTEKRVLTYDVSVGMQNRRNIDVLQFFSCVGGSNVEQRYEMHLLEIVHCETSGWTSSDAVHNGTGFWSQLKLKNWLKIKLVESFIEISLLCLLCFVSSQQILCFQKQVDKVQPTPDQRASWTTSLCLAIQLAACRKPVKLFVAVQRKFSRN